ncbi:MAG: hypothetical protein MUE44_16980 [Oscillatoriaceae cyanobacterium Prado104]|nr:hypothetical protein [Oscillatoriaceae cyanobacterium Prado104]
MLDWIGQSFLPHQFIIWLTKLRAQDSECAIDRPLINTVSLDRAVSCRLRPTSQMNSSVLHNFCRSGESQALATQIRDIAFPVAARYCDRADRR